MTRHVFAHLALLLVAPLACDAVTQADPAVPASESQAHEPLADSPVIRAAPPSTCARLVYVDADRVHPGDQSLAARVVVGAVGCQTPQAGLRLLVTAWADPHEAPAAVVTAPLRPVAPGLCREAASPWSPSGAESDALSLRAGDYAAYRVDLLNVAGDLLDSAFIPSDLGPGHVTPPYGARSDAEGQWHESKPYNGLCAHQEG